MHTVKRRRFLGMMGTAVAAPWIVPASVLDQIQRAAPSERITIGFIGTGKMANDYHLVVDTLTWVLTTTTSPNGPSRWTVPAR